MILADLGADVIRIDRPGGGMFTIGEKDLLNRGRPSVALDLKQPAAVATVLALVEQADVLVEGMRPGTLERLGLGPDECHARNPRLVYGRMTGWGQDGPWSQAAGPRHELHRDHRSPPRARAGPRPAALPEQPRRRLRRRLDLPRHRDPRRPARGAPQRTGQVVDAAIVDGTAHLNAMASTFAALGLDTGTRRSGLLDGGTPWYDLYETADGKHLSLGALEPQFWAELVARSASSSPTATTPPTTPPSATR